MRKLLRLIWRLLSFPFRVVYHWIKNIFTNIRILLTEEPEDEPLPDTFAKTMENPMGVMEHLDALRKHLLRAVAFLFVMTAISLVFARNIIDLLAQPVGGIDELIAIDVTEPISVFMRVALLMGFALSLPYLTFEVKRKESF